MVIRLHEGLRRNIHDEAAILSASAHWARLVYWQRPGNSSFGKDRETVCPALREQQGDFSLTEAGIYGLWLSGKNYTPVSIGTFGLELCNLANGEKVPLRAVLLRTAVTGFSRARVELYTFRAEAGCYQLTVTGKGLLRDQPVGGLLRALRPQACNLSACDVEIYRHSPVIWLFLSICGIIAGSFFLLGGILLPLLLQSSM